MPIVKSEKRPETKKLIRELQRELASMMRQADSLQVRLEALELTLGLANEGEQAARDQCIVMHYRKGEEQGHTLDECTSECLAEDILEELGERDEPPKKLDQDDIGDGSGTGD